MSNGKVQLFSSIVQFVATQQETNNNNYRKTPIGAVRCLFGVPDHHETRFLLEDELRRQEESFFDRWDFEDLDTENSENCRKRKARNDEDEENEEGRIAKRLFLEETCSEDILPRRILQPRNTLQRQITGKFLTLIFYLFT